MESPKFLSHPMPRAPRILVPWCSVQLLPRRNPPILGLGLRKWRSWNHRSQGQMLRIPLKRLCSFLRSHSQGTKMGFQSSLCDSKPLYSFPYSPVSFWSSPRPTQCWNPLYKCTSGLRLHIPMSGMALYDRTNFLALS